VMFLGVQVGIVSKLKLMVDLNSAVVKARVDMRLQPGRIFSNLKTLSGQDPITGFQRLVDHGMRVELASGNIVTGQKIISFVMVPNAAAATVTQDGKALVLPSQPGGLDAIMQSLASVSGKLDKLPLQQIGDNMNKLIVTANRTLAHAPIDRTLNSVSKATASTNQLLQSLSRSYGPDSNFQINLDRLISQSNDTLRSVQQLSDYLTRHPQSIVFGRSKH
jgi:paraquat-inducible protein B